MAITYVDNAENTTAGSSPHTISVDIGTRTNGLLVVGVSGFSSNNISAFSATYNGVAMTRDRLEQYAHSSPNQLFAALFSLENPSNGANDLVLTWTVDSGGSITVKYTLASWYDGANQTDATDLNAGGSGTTDPSVDITPSEDNCLIVSIYESEANNVLSVGSGETEINNHDFGARVVGGSYAIQTTAATQTVDWAGADDYWVMAVASYKAAAGSGATEITPAEATQAQSSDAVSATPIYVITVTEGTQAQLSDAASITAEGPNYPITPAEATQAQASDAVSIVAISPITPAEAAQAQTSDAVSLAAIYLLTPAEATQSQTSDAGSIGQFTPIEPAEATQAQTSDAVSLAAVYPLAPAEAAQAQASDAVTVTAIYPVAPAEATQAQTSDAAEISFQAPGEATNITPAEATHAQVSDAVSLAAIYPIAPAEAIQAQTADDAGIVAVYLITPAEATQSQTCDAVSLTVYEPTYNITPAEATQAQTADVTSLTIIYVLSVADATQAQTSDAGILTLTTQVYPPGERLAHELNSREYYSMPVRSTGEIGTRETLAIGVRGHSDVED